MTLEEAKAEVSASAQTDQFPNLTPEQVETLVVKNQRATVWTAGHAYKVGDKVQPTERNGFFYRCKISGLSATTEPNWADGKWNTVYDGSNVVWNKSEEDVDGNLYNVRNAIFDAWMLKASMAAKDFDISIDNQKWNRSQIYDHCMDMARAYSPFD